MARIARPKICGVYSISSPSGKAYIGSSIDIYTRWASHKRDLRTGTHKNSALQRCLGKYGDEALVWEILDECSPENRFKLEAMHIAAKNKNGGVYNHTPVIAGAEFSAAYRAKLSAKGRARHNRHRIKAGLLPLITPEDYAEHERVRDEASRQRRKQADPIRFKAREAQRVRVTTKAERAKDPIGYARKIAELNKANRLQAIAADAEGRKAKRNAWMREKYARDKAADPEALKVLLAASNAKTRAKQKTAKLALVAQ